MNYQKYILLDDPVENVVQDGQVVGFTLKMGYPNYRGMYLSYTEDIMVTLDGEAFYGSQDQLTLTLASGTWKVSEFSSCGFHRWNFAEKGTIFVKKPGGIAPGKHRIEAGLKNRGYFGSRNDFVGGWRDIEMK